ncbi:MAG: DUF4388 domain-containing protein [Acidobacteria bacterium]|nr:DUF4388 domain-containing protein [Acidobacteriota bacterium]
MSLTGTLDTMSLTDLLQWIQQSRKTGALVIHGERYSKKILIRDGTIVSSSSDDPTEHLGHFLLRQDRITEPDLRKALETQQKTGVMLGKILVTVGLIEEPELRRLLVQKAEETIFGLFLWTEARFEFVDAPLPREILVPLNLRIEDVLLKGLAWFDELQHVRREFASALSVLARTSKEMPKEFHGARSLARRILDMVDGRRCIADICMEVHASEFTVSKLLYLMFKQGFVRVEKNVTVAVDAPRKTLSGFLEEARQHARAGRAEEALKVLDEAAPLSPHDMSLRSLREECRAVVVAQMTKDGVEPTRIPVLVKPLEALTGEKLSPEEVFILSRVNGSWDVRSIVNLCPFLEAEALVHIKKLRERGILSLEARG